MERASIPASPLARSIALAISLALTLGVSASLGGCARRALEVPSLRLPATAPGAGLEPGEVYRAAWPDAPPVTAASLPDAERFWPHQIQLVEEWKPEGWSGEFGWGLGVLIRVDRERGLRVDFSRFGKHWVPIGVTDAVRRAEAIRLDEAHKYAPNLVLALKNRLLDPSGTTLVETGVDPMTQRAFVLVFADPLAPGFTDLARDLRALDAREDVMVVLLAQGGHSDAFVYKACYDAGFPGVFLLDRFAEAYTEGFLDRPPTVPRVQVASPEGRLLWEGSWMPGLGEVLHARFAEP